MVTRRKIAILSFFVLCVSSYFSIHWMIPVWKENQPESSYKYLPIHFYPGSYSDDYFYYSRIREVIDGRLYSGDHATIEHKLDSTPHATYSLSFFLGSIGGWVTKQTQHAYEFNYFVFPALSFLGLFFLGTFMKLPFAATILIAVQVMLSQAQIERTPNCLITNVFLNCLAICLFQKFERRNESRWWDIGLILILGVSSITSIPNMFISYGLFAAFCISYSSQGINRRGYSKILIASLLVSFPGLYFIIQELVGKTPEFIDFAIPPLEQYSGIHFDQMKASLSQFLSIPLVIALVARYPLKRFHMTVILSAFVTYLGVSLLRGTFVARYVFLRGGEVLVWFIIYSACAHAAIAFLKIHLEKIKTGERQRAVAKFAGVLLLILSLAIAGLGIGRKREETFASLSVHDLPELKALTTWATHSVLRNEPAVILDFDLIANIGAYTPFDTYLAFAHQSPVSTPERHQRFYETIRFFGQDRNFLESRLRHMQGNDMTGVTDPALIDLSLMQLVMFYGRYSDGKIPETKIQEMLAEFDQLNKNEQKFRFSYQARYLILSKVSEPFVVAGSPADLVRKQSKPVFQNSKYVVYPL